MSKLRLAIVEVMASERTELESLAKRRKTAQALALRARIVLGCASGLHNKDVAAQLGIDPVTVSKWRRRFLSDRLEGLRDEPRSGTPRTVDDRRIEAVITQTLESLPDNATHWSSRGMARASGLSVSTVQRIWRAFGLQPHREATFKLSNGPDFVDKVRDIVGLYVAPPAHAIVLCVDEKSQIQALDRSQPLLICRRYPRLHRTILPQKCARMNFWFRTLERAAVNLGSPTKAVYPELVEGLHFFFETGRGARRKGQCFDKLSMDGVWCRFNARCSKRKPPRPPPAPWRHVLSGRSAGRACRRWPGCRRARCRRCGCSGGRGRARRRRGRSCPIRIGRPNASRYRPVPARSPSLSHRPSPSAPARRRCARRSRWLRARGGCG